MGTLNKKENSVLIIENFLPNLNHYLQDIYKIKTYDKEQFNIKFNRNESWPGKRSDDLNICSPFLFFLVLQNLEKVFFLKKYYINLYLHLRRNEDIHKDWVHKDSNNDYSFLIYLNQDNFNSGTYIYNDEKKIITDIKYVQNRFVLYNANYFHQGYGHFGSSEENGRLTINGFVNMEND